MGLGSSVVGGNGNGGGGGPQEGTRQNNSGVSIPAHRVCFLRSDDTLEMTDADDSTKGTAAVITKETIINGNSGAIYYLGPVIPGILDGRGFTPGKMIYESETTGEMISEESGDLPSDVSDVLYKLGIATNLSGGEAKDLITQPERKFN